MSGTEGFFENLGSIFTSLGALREAHTCAQKQIMVEERDSQMRDDRAGEIGREDTMHRVLVQASMQMESLISYLKVRNGEERDGLHAVG